MRLRRILSMLLLLILVIRIAGRGDLAKAARRGEERIMRRLKQ
ncbi:MAG: hypothetical protein ACP5NY_04835 [Thermocladium sp.]